MKTGVMLTSKQITIEDLKNTDHVGWIDTSDRKCFIVQIDSMLRCVGEQIDYSCNLQYDNGGTSMKQALNSIKKDCNGQAQVKQLYRFDTRRELYQWLAEYP